jgi:hypothetical protein
MFDLKHLTHDINYERSIGKCLSRSDYEFYLIMMEGDLRNISHEYNGCPKCDCSRCACFANKLLILIQYIYKQRMDLRAPNPDYRANDPRLAHTNGPRITGEDVEKLRADITRWHAKMEASSDDE